MLRPAPRRGPISGWAVLAGWLVSVCCAVPASYYLGIWFSGWEEPPGHIVRGATLNPLLSGAGTAIVLSFFGLVVLVSVAWIRVLVRQRHHELATTPFSSAVGS